MSKARNLATLLTTDGSVKPTKYADSVGGQATFVASGALPNGSPVILNSDGTVSVVGTVVADVTLTLAWPAGSYTAMTSSGTNGNMDSDFNKSIANQFVVVYGDNTNSNFHTCIVGTVNGTAITFGSAVVYLSSSCSSTMVKFDPNRSDKFVIYYQDNSDSYKRKLLVGTISGTTPAFAYSPVDVTTGYGNTSYRNCLQFDPFNADKFLIIYQDGSSPTRVRVCTINNASAITLGTAVQAVTASTQYQQITLDQNTANKFLITYKDGNGDGSAKAGTISGNSVTFGAEFTFDTGNSYYICTDSEKGRSGKFLVGTYDQPNSGRTQLRVLTVTGTTVTAGTVTSLANGPFYMHGMHNDPNSTGSFIFTGQIGASPYSHKAYTASVSSGDIVTVAGPYDVSGGQRGDFSAIAFDPNNNGKFVFGGGYNTSLSTWGTKYGVGQLGGVYQGSTSNLTTSNFIAISSAAYADTETATLNLQGGTATNLSGLTAGSTYYVQNDGTLGTSAGNPSVEAGKALSTTSILLKGI